jgi:molybdopterin molybdotransferase
MIKVSQAKKIILNTIKPIGSETVMLREALGRVLAESVYSHIDVPGFDNSAMDGFALRSGDSIRVSKDKPKILQVIEDIKAGDVPKKVLRQNQVARIMTGAMIPRGADCVVMVEETEKIENNFIKIFREIKKGEHIRKKGEDIKNKERILEKGRRLNAQDIGLLASIGKSKIKVAKKPKVAFLVTGDEVIDVHEKLTPGKIRSSNSYTLYGQIIDSGGIPENLGIARDRPQELEKKIKLGLNCNLMITSGGVSVGDYDLVKDTLKRLGTNFKFWKVRMRPGKPLAFGLISTKNIGGSAAHCGGRGIPVFGLPGNPVSSMISFEIFVRPSILKMLGQKEDIHKEVDAILQEDIEKKKGLKHFLRAMTFWKDDSYYTGTTGPQGSAILKSMSLANSIIILPEEEEFIKRGTRVKVRFLE